MGEIWKDIDGYDGIYQISNFGNLISHYWSKSIIRKPQSKNGDYVRVILHKKEKQSIKYIHRLIAESFIPNPQQLPQVNHKNGIKTDNRIENLEWVTSSQNQHHAYDTGLLKQKNNEDHHKSKLSNKDVLEIRQIGNSLSHPIVGEMYGVAPSTISGILLGMNWKHL